MSFTFAARMRVEIMRSRIVRVRVKTTSGDDKLHPRGVVDVQDDIKLRYCSLDTFFLLYCFFV